MKASQSVFLLAVLLAVVLGVLGSGCLEEIQRENGLGTNQDQDQGTGSEGSEVTGTWRAFFDVPADGRTYYMAQRLYMSTISGESSAGWVELYLRYQGGQWYEESGVREEPYISLQTDFKQPRIEPKPSSRDKVYSHTSFPAGGRFSAAFYSRWTGSPYSLYYPYCPLARRGWLRTLEIRDLGDGEIAGTRRIEVRVSCRGDPSTVYQGREYGPVSPSGDFEAGLPGSIWRWLSG